MSRTSELALSFVRRGVMILGLALTVAACSDPRLNAGLSLGSDGLRVRPSVSAEVGGLNVEVSP